MSKKLKRLSERSIILLFLMMTACFIWAPEKSIVLSLLLFLGVVFYMSIFDQNGHFIAGGRYSDILIGICLKTVDYVYWMTIVTVGIYAAIAVLKEKNRKALWLITILVGGSLLILLIECEGRYKYCIQPVWSLCSVWGMVKLSEKVKKWRGSVSDRSI